LPTGGLNQGLRSNAGKRGKINVCTLTDKTTNDRKFIGKQRKSH